MRLPLTNISELVSTIEEEHSETNDESSMATSCAVCVRFIALYYYNKRTSSPGAYTTEMR